MAETRVFVMHPDVSVRAALCAPMDREPGLTVVGETGPVEPDAVLAHEPHVVVLAVRDTPEGIELCRELEARDPDLRCLVLVGNDEDQALLTAILVGAAGYLREHAADDDVVEAVRDVAAGRDLVAERLRARPVQAGTPDEDVLADLTEQERRVAELLAEGLTNPEIAERLHLSRHTVRNYVSQVLRKLHARNRTQVAALMTSLARARRATRGRPVQ